MLEPEDYPRPPMRRRLLVVLLAISTAAFLVWSVTRKSGVVRNAALHPADVAVCAKDQTQGCVGGTAAVISLPPAEPASR